MSGDKKIEYIEEEGGDNFERKYKKLKKELSGVKNEKQEYLDGWQRARAEMQNLVKQKDAEMRDFRQFATGEIILKMISFLDNLGFIIESAPESIKDDPWLKGIKNTEKHFLDMLKSEGLLEINAEAGDEFDPSRHDAVEEAESDEKSGKISEVIQKGYTLNGKVIRPSRVKVAK